MRHLLAFALVLAAAPASAGWQFYDMNGPYFTISDPAKAEESVKLAQQEMNKRKPTTPDGKAIPGAVSVPETGKVSVEMLEYHLGVVQGWHAQFGAIAGAPLDDTGKEALKAIDGYKGAIAEAKKAGDLEKRLPMIHAEQLKAWRLMTLWELDYRVAESKKRTTQLEKSRDALRKAQTQEALSESKSVLKQGYRGGRS